MKKHFTKKLIVITAVALLLFVAAGSTLAFLVTQAGPLENEFKPSTVACAVVENDKDPVTAAVVDIGNSKENVMIKNTGDTDAYIRVAVVVNWMDGRGKVWAAKPVAGEDYTITYPSDTGWTDGQDGFFYYSGKVEPGDMTGILISHAEQLKSGPVGTDGTQYRLSIEIVASAIQAEGMGAGDAQTAWAKAQQGN